jgi:GNAT superfamily N-acetyltransferase
MDRYECGEAADFVSRVGAAACPGHRIARAFADGKMGYALVGSRGHAVIVGDIGTLGGDFDPEVYQVIAGMKEAHLFDPPDSWCAGISRDATRKTRAYERIEFDPVAPASPGASEQAPPARDGGAGTDPGTTIVPIDAASVEELLAEEWCADAVRHTMAPGREAVGFGFVARRSGLIVGVVGCYAVYADGVEVQIDTREGYRRRGIAAALGARMVGECGDRGVACHWDAMNVASAALARRLGFRERRRYRCIEVTPDDRAPRG